MYVYIIPNVDSFILGTKSFGSCHRSPLFGQTLAESEQFTGHTATEIVRMRFIRGFKGTQLSEFNRPFQPWL